MTNSRYKTVLLFGAPGSGKGTQGKILGQIPGFFHLSCGHLVCSDEEQMIRRMRRRAIRENRADDADEKVIRRRFQVYHEESAPVLDYYPASMIVKVDAIGSPAEVLLKVLECVVPVQNEHFQRPAS